MRVLYDHQAFQMQYFGGVSKCFCELIGHMPAEVEPHISIVESNNVHLRESGLVPGLKPVSIDHKQWGRRHPGRLMDILYLAANKLLPLPTADSRNRRATYAALRAQEFDVFHPTFFKPEFLSLLGTKPFVLTIHDMTPELFPQYFGADPQVRWKRQLVDRAAAVVTVSECTKRDVIRLLGVPEEKISVIYHGGPQRIQARSTERVIFGPYFFYVGQRFGYKNFGAMLRAFAVWADRNPDLQHRLVCTGASLTSAEKQLIHTLGLECRVIHLHASDQEMQILYQWADAFVYPSDYEGFGMPILEAYANGCPVLLNRASCFPEVAGDAAIYFDSHDVEGSFAAALQRVVEWSAAERQELVARGYERLEMFSWQKAALQLADVYKKVIQ